MQEKCRSNSVLILLQQFIVPPPISLAPIVENMTTVVMGCKSYRLAFQYADFEVLFHAFSFLFMHLVI